MICQLKWVWCFVWQTETICVGYQFLTDNDYIIWTKMVWTLKKIETNCTCPTKQCPKTLTFEMVLIFMDSFQSACLMFETANYTYSKPSKSYWFQFDVSMIVTFHILNFCTKYSKGKEPARVVALVHLHVIDAFCLLACNLLLGFPQWIP